LNSKRARNAKSKHKDIKQHSTASIRLTPHASIRLTPPCTANEEANERFRVRLGFKVMADILITEIGERDTWAACSPRCQLSRFIQIQIAFKLVFKIAFKLVFV
jgi:hypothetical protein